MAVGPAARLALASFGAPPAFDDLMGWAARVRAGEPLASVAADVVPRPAFATRYGSLADAAFVAAAHENATGATASSGWVSARSIGATRADVMAEVVSLAGCGRLAWAPRST